MRGRGSRGRWGAEHPRRGAPSGRSENSRPGRGVCGGLQRPLLTEPARRPATFARHAPHPPRARAQSGSGCSLAVGRRAVPAAWAPDCPPRAGQSQPTGSGAPAASWSPGKREAAAALNRPGLRPMAGSLGKLSSGWLWLSHVARFSIHPDPREETTLGTPLQGFSGAL